METLEKDKQEKYSSIHKCKRQLYLAGCLYLVHFILLLVAVDILDD